MAAPGLHLAPDPTSPFLCLGRSKGTLRMGRREDESVTQEEIPGHPHGVTEGPIGPTLPTSHATVRLLLLKLPGQYLVGGQKSHTHVEEDLPEVPQPVQVHVAQANGEQHQHHLPSPGGTVE